MAGSGKTSIGLHRLAYVLYCNKDTIAEDYSYFMRTVKKPQYIISKDLFSCIVPILEQLEKYNSVAVIVNSDEEAIAVKSNLQEYKEAQLIISPADEMKSRLVIIPLLLAKGLEFDAVILFNCIYSNEKNALYHKYNDN